MVSAKEMHSYSAMNKFLTVKASRRSLHKRQTENLGEESSFLGHRIRDMCECARVCVCVYARQGDPSLSPLYALPNPVSQTRVLKKCLLNK